MVQRMRTGTQPPSGLPLELSAVTPSVVPVRDVFGNIVGGIRLPDFAVPTATNTGINFNPVPPIPGVLCNLYGQYIPFDQQMLRALYPTAGTYLLDTVAASNAAVAAGYLLDEDATGADSTAAESGIGGPNLRNLDLGGVNLMGVSLPNENLAGDNLTGANLSNSNLQGTNLKGANLNGANLTGANLIGAVLQSANLQGADMTNANLAGATLQGASFGGAEWSNTVCPDGTNRDFVGSTCVGHLGKL
jgi:Alpha/beta hydrolase domain/Pentapeptide repeats (8 copies)